MELSAEAEALVGRLGREVKGLNREAVIDEAGQTAKRAGRSEVTADDVTLGAILVTPGHLRPDLRRAMREAGVDIERWAAYFTL